MNRWLIILLIVTLSSAKLRAAMPPASTQPSPVELHDRAYQLMREGRFDLATPLLVRAYDRTPPLQRSRSLILNRADLDLVQRANPMRGVKDLHEYMTLQKAPDEEASNLLGSLLDVASQTPRLRDSRLYKDTFREFARREAALERARPGFKRWGAQWVTEADRDTIKARDRDLEAQMNDQVILLNRIAANMQSASQRYENVRKQVLGLARHRHAARVTPTDERGLVFVQPGEECATCRALNEASDSATELAAELRSLQVELQTAERRVAQSQAKLSKPQWPRRYAPIDPNAPPPAPREPTVAGAVPPTSSPSEVTGVESAGAVSADPATPAAPVATQPAELIH